MPSSPRQRRAVLLTPLLTAALAMSGWISATPAQAYVGPGAGFAVLSSFFVLFTTIVVVTLSVLAWPFRAAWRLLTGRRPPRAAIRRLIVVGPHLLNRPGPRSRAGLRGLFRPRPRPRSA